MLVGPRSLLAGIGAAQGPTWQLHPSPARPQKGPVGRCFPLMGTGPRHVCVRDVFKEEPQEW